MQSAWQEAIAAFGELLEAYREAYETQIRERGVVSHTDCAFLLAEVLRAGSDLDAGSDAGSSTDADPDADTDTDANSDSDAETGTDADANTDSDADTGTDTDADGVPGGIRERVLARYRSRIESVIIDEAQDLSTLQHAALAPVITGDCRVHAAGDVRQAISGVAERWFCR